MVLADCTDEASVSPSETALCNAADLTAALVNAEPGDVVRVGACTMAGSFTVPAGVTLRGKDRDASIVEASGNRPAVRLLPGDPPARLTDLRIRSSGHAGVLLVDGAGSVAVERIVVEAARGMALAGEDLTSVVLSEVFLVGPVTTVNQRAIPPLATAEETATHGLVLVRVGTATLTNVTVTGFAQFGALLVSCGCRWTGGGAPANRGVGLMLFGGNANLESLDLSDTFGETTPIPSYGGVFAGGARVDTSGLRVSGGANFGLLHDAADVRHADLVASDNRESGVWVQGCPSFAVDGATLLRNGMGGLVLVDTGDTTLRRMDSAETRLLPAVFGEIGRVDVGAGLEVVRPLGIVSLSESALSRNEQVGLLVQLDGGGTMDGFSFADVAVEGLDGQFGAVAQGGSVIPGWDTGITRDTTTALNDESRVGALDRVGSLGTADMPAVTDVVDQGLVGVIDPDPPF
jgi:hypothetical protein